MIFILYILPDASTKTFLKMYLAACGPTIICCACLGYQQGLVTCTSLERIQKLALRMHAKDWSTSYEDL